MHVLLGVVIGLVLGAAGVLGGLRFATGSRLEAARRTRALLLDEAKRDADATRREAQIESREQAVKVRAELEAELRERRDEAVKIQERVIQKEEESDRRLFDLSRREQGVADREIHLKELQEALKQANERQRRELERVAKMTRSEARQRILEESEDEVRHELAGRVRRLEEEAAGGGEAPGAQPGRGCAPACRRQCCGRGDGDARRTSVR